MQTPWARAKHGVRWQVNAMIGVTDNASGQTCGIKGRFVRTLFVHLGLENVAVGADILHLVHTGGTAPWFPWQVVQVGALRSPFTIIA